MSGASRHNYDYGVDLEADTAPARVIRLTGHKKKVLEIGAGPGSITRHLTETNKCDVVALEIDPTAIEILRNYCRKVYSFDLNNKHWPRELDAEGKFDVVIAADVLEHVYDPLTVLRGMKSLLNEDGYIILSLPHVAHCVINACLLDEDFEYRDWGLLDRTHVRFFGLKNIQTLYANAGMSITEAQFVIRTPEQTEFADRWAALPEFVRAALSTNPHCHIYQVVSVAKPVGRAERSVTLLDVPVAPTWTGPLPTMSDSHMTGLVNGHAAQPIVQQAAPHTPPSKPFRTAPMREALKASLPNGLTRVIQTGLRVTRSIRDRRTTN